MKPNRLARPAGSVVLLLGGLGFLVLTNRQVFTNSVICIGLWAVGAALWAPAALGPSGRPRRGSRPTPAIGRESPAHRARRDEA